MIVHLLYVVVAHVPLLRPSVNLLAPRVMTTALVVCAVLCTRAAAMLYDEKVKTLTKDLKVFTYDLAGHGLMPPLETFSMQNPVCKQCEGLSFPHWTECNYGFGIPEESPVAAGHQGFLWRGVHDSALHVHYRLTHSSLSTTNASEAQLFFIPIYPLLFSYRQPKPTYCGPLLLEYMDYERLWSWLRRQETYKKSDGADHFMVVAHPWAMAKNWPLFKRLGLDDPSMKPDERAAEKAKFAKIFKLVVDTNADNPGKHPDPRNPEEEAASKNILRNLNSVRQHPENAFQIPYSTGIHYFHTPFPFSRLLVSSASTSAGEARLTRHVEHERPLFASYLTSVRHGQVPDTEYLMIKRKTLVLCMKASECRVHLLNPNIRRESLKHIVRHIKDDSSVPSALGLAGLHELVEFAKDRVEVVHYLSQFCLTPPGDTVSRKGLFDAILMGCIPVIFYPMSAYYPWHLPAGDGPEGLESFAVYIPGKEVLANRTIVMDRLHSIPQEKIRAMQRQLAVLAPRIQYAVTYGEEHGKDRWGGEDGWGPDALDIAVAGLVLNGRRQ